MTTIASPTQASAAELAAAVHAREISPVEIVEAHLALIEERNPELNAIVTLRADEALAEAKAVHLDSPLAGVPFTVKDVIATGGIRTTCGSRVLADHVPARDATAVTRLRAAGAILLGKTNCSEFALWPHTANPLFGATCNPLGAVTPGGSSGGDSAAVAAGLVPLGLGGDFGGSLRWPAQCTGIVALRPTVGRVPTTGSLPSPGPAPNSVSLQGRLQVLGPLARRVDDLELALRVLGGPDPLDPAAVPVPLAPRADFAALSHKLAWCDGDGVTPVRADVAAAVGRAGAALGAIEARPAALERANELYTRLRRLEGLHELRAAVAGHEEELGEPLRALLAESHEGSVAELVELWAERDALRGELLGFLEEHPVLLLPVSAVPAYDFDTTPRVAGRELSAWEVLAPSRAISLFGLPAASVPCGRSDEGLPVSVQVVGRPFREDEVLAVAAAVEAA